MATEPQPRYYKYLNSDMYPRVEFFQRMLSTLLPRFIHITKIMDEFYVDKDRVTKIQFICKQLLGNPKIFIINPGEEFELYRTVALKKYFIPAVYKELNWKSLSENDCLLTVVVYYFRGTEQQVYSKRFSDELKRHVNDFLPYTDSAQTSHDVGQSETGPISSLFIVCDIDGEHKNDDKMAEMYTRIKESILSSIKSVREDGRMEEPASQLNIHRQLDLSEILHLSGIVNARYRLNVGKKMDIGCEVSTFLEDRVLLGFDFIDNFLLDFRKIDQSCFRVSKSAYEDKRIVVSIDGLFCNLEVLILTMKDQYVITQNNQSSKLDLKNVYFILIKVISFSLKSVIIQILWEKYGLCQILIHKCLIKVDFQKEVEKSLNTHVSLSDRVRGFFSKYFSSLSENTDSNEIQTSKNLSSHEEVKNTSEEDEIKALTSDIVSGLKDSIQKFEEEVARVNKVIELIKKMNFEISGYYKRTKLRHSRNNPTLPLSKDLQSELLSLNDVIGCGFIYSVFEILVREESEDDMIEDTIQDIIDKYRYLGQYTLKRVRVTKSGGLGFTQHGFYVKG